MADLPSSFVKVNDVEVAQDAPNTEALMAKLGSNDNYLKDNLDAEITARAAADSTLTTNVSSVTTLANNLKTQNNALDEVIQFVYYIAITIPFNPDQSAPNVGLNPTNWWVFKDVSTNECFVNVYYNGTKTTTNITSASSGAVTGTNWDMVNMYLYRNGGSDFNLCLNFMKRHTVTNV